MDKAKLAIVDDHKLFRDGLTELINGFNEYKIIIEADNGADFIKQLDQRGIPDVVLLDINMKEMDGYQTAAWLKEHHPEVRVLALSMYENENAIIRMLKAGARGYVLKDIRKKELKEALASLVSKGYYYTEMITGRLIHVVSTLDDARPGQSVKELVSMTDREIEFLKLACTELTYKDIAERMNLSSHTIDGYRDALFEKLNVKSRIGLVLYAIRNKIVMVD
jgi:two-component system, NarL family, invasion response regulator UvrY